MPILPLEQFEEDLRSYEDEQRAIAALKPPTTIVVKFGVMGLIGEFPYRGDMTPGCGSKIVVRTQRGIEMGDMLTTTCQNSGCSKSISRQEMLEYIDRSGGRQYPFFTNGRALRVASMEDMTRQEEIDTAKPAMRDQARDIVRRLGYDIKIVEVEPILSGDRVTVYYTGEGHFEPRALLAELTSLYGVKIDLRQVGARDEARLVADYERCGQYCCCKNFLKVLKPISMKAAKTQKATLDPLKISGRCGRLMCCLRYEEQTYDELRKNLPKRKTRVGTPDGDGIVIDSQILTQLVLVRLDAGTDVAVPLEELTEPGLERAPEPAPAPAPTFRRAEPRRDGPRGPRPGPGERRPSPAAAPVRDDASGPSAQGAADAPPKRKKRRRKRKPVDGAAGQQPAAMGTGGPAGGDADAASSEAGPAEGGDLPRKKKRRRRKRRPGEAGGGDGGQAGDGGAGPVESGAGPGDD